MFARQSEMLMPEEELGSQSPVSYEEDFEDLSSNADLYVFNNQTIQGYRGVDINNTRDNVIYFNWKQILSAWLQSCNLHVVKQ